MFFDQFQQEVRAWSEKNFPENTDVHPFHGIVEEVGELGAALIAKRAAVEDFMDPAPALADFKDAIGDIVVYMADYCNRRRFRIEGILDQAGFEVTNFAGLQFESFMSREGKHPFPLIVVNVGKLSHSRLKRMQGIRGSAEKHVVSEREAIGEILINLALLCQKGKHCLDTIVSDTWFAVSKRDWTKNRASGQVTETPCISRSKNPYES